MQGGEIELSPQSCRPYKKDHAQSLTGGHKACHWIYCGPPVTGRVVAGSKTVPPLMFGRANPFTCRTRGRKSVSEIE